MASRTLHWQINIPYNPVKSGSFPITAGMTWRQAIEKMWGHPDEWMVLSAFGYKDLSDTIDLPGVYQLTIRGGCVGPSGVIQVV